MLWRACGVVCIVVMWCAHSNVLSEDEVDDMLPGGELGDLGSGLLADSDITDHEADV